MAKTNKMQTFFLIVILIGGLLAVIGGFGYNYYSNLANEEKEENAQKERLDIKDKISEGNNNLDSKIDNQDSILSEIKQGQFDIKNQVKSSNDKKKPDIKIENSPNSIIQVNENGDNIINKTEIPEPKIEVLEWMIKNDKVNKISKRRGRQIEDIPNEKTPYDYLFYNQIKIKYTSAISLNRIIFILKKYDVIYADSQINGMQMVLKSGQFSQGYCIILSQPHNGIYIINYYSKNELTNPFEEFDYLK